MGPKGSGRFERVSWDEALDEIAGRFTRVCEEYGGQAILPYSYLGTEGILNGLTVGDPFFHRLGASVSERTFCDSGSCTAYFMTVGPTAGMDPLRHRTAQHADWYIPIRPGTDGALALGMMHVLVAEGLVDADYVQRHTVGYAELAARVREYTPDRVSAITGVPSEHIVTLAREYAATQPSAIRIGVAVERHAGGGQTVRAIACLPALVGAWRHVGGGLLQLPLWAFPINWGVLSRPDLIRPGTRVINQFRLGPALTGELDLDPPIKALFVYNSNPVVVSPDQAKTLAGLSREDLFTVVSEQFLTDTADYADIVLPATTQLEQFDLMFSWGHLYLSLNQPAIASLGEAIPNVEQFRRLNARMGFEDDWYGLTDEEMATAALDWSAPTLQGISLERLKREGWARLNLPDADHYAPHAEGNFPTPSGKCEFLVLLGRTGRELRGPGLPGGLQRVPARHRRRPDACLRAAGGGPGTLAIPAVPAVPQVSRLLELPVRQHGLPAPGSGRAERDHACRRRRGPRDRGRPAGPGVQRAGGISRHCPSQLGQPGRPRCGGVLARPVAEDQSGRQHRERGHPHRLR